MARYKVAAEAMVEYTHWAAGGDKRQITVTEERILADLDLGSLSNMKRCKDAAYDLSRARIVFRAK